MADVILKDGQCVFLETTDGLVEITVSLDYQGEAKLEIMAPRRVLIVTEEQLGLTRRTVH